MKHFLNNEWDKSQAQKRGGGRAPISIELSEAEAAYRLEPVDEITPERAFQRRWALTLLDSVLNQLRLEYVAGGKKDLFDRIKGKLTHRNGTENYREIAADLSMSEGAVKVAVHRLRKRYRELLVHEVSQTVTTAGEIDDEVGDLFKAVSN